EASRAGCRSDLPRCVPLALASAGTIVALARAGSPRARLPQAPHAEPSSVGDGAVRIGGRGGGRGRRSSTARGDSYSGGAQTARFIATTGPPRRLKIRSVSSRFHSYQPAPRAK